MSHSMHATYDRPTVLLLGIQAPYNKTKDIDSYWKEFIKLAEANELEYDHTLFTKLREIDSSYFLTKGKLEELREFCEKHAIDHVIVSEPLTAMQERNIQNIINAKVFDRTRLILEIFEKAAHSAEGKKQVEIAMLQHKKTRLAGRGIHLSQQAGGIGTRGPGETAKEKDIRHIEEGILKLKRQLLKIEKSRQTQRKKRIESSYPLFCLIGYTNAGKSTILNALTKSTVHAQDKLFATLDTTTRELYINNEKKGLISDTVGFIQQLPHQLIDAFKSTLSELHFADLLIHVIDLSDSNWELHIKVVHEILDDLDVDKPMVYVFNKSDQIPEKQIFEDRIAQYQPQVVISATSKKGIKPLIDFLANWSAK